jgi:ParB family chromosome partitioning protein
MPSSVVEIEFHQIQLRYRHTRVWDESVIEQLGRSIVVWGQLLPVTVGLLAPDRYVLIDGYLRVEALKRRGFDTVQAHVIDGDEKQAVAQVIMRDDRRRLKHIEQAWLLQELAQRFDQSVRQLARLVGRDASWVQRRLDLVRSLPAPVLRAVSQAKITLWSAERILAPLARANTTHAKALCDYLCAHTVSTRRLQALFDHYKRSQKAVRQNIIDDPELFFKTLEQQKHQRQARRLRRGPEGQFLDELNALTVTCKRLADKAQPLAPALKAQHQSISEKLDALDTHLKQLNQVFKS